MAPILQMFIYSAISEVLCSLSTLRLHTIHTMILIHVVRTPSLIMFLQFHNPFLIHLISFRLLRALHHANLFLLLSIPRHLLPNLRTTRPMPDIPTPPHNSLQCQRRTINRRPHIQIKHRLSVWLVISLVVVDNVSDLLSCVADLALYVPVVAIEGWCGTVLDISNVFCV